MEELRANDYLKGIVLNLPEKPGIYQYLDSGGTIIYVGKAKNLKRRVSSYFNRDHGLSKTRILVSKIADIRYIVVKTEEDALLLENNLIKKYKPRYNVLLKDDKTYPSICISGGAFPKVFKTRNIVHDGSLYFGPYSHVGAMNLVLDLIKRLYPLRTCRHALTPENIRQGKFKPCLEYHINNCAAPCIGLQSQADYMQNIENIKRILRGNAKEVGKMLYQRMQNLSAELRFEEAQAVKEKYLLIENFRTKSEVVNHTLNNIDVFAIETDDSSNTAYINFLHIANGTVNQAFTFEYKKRLNETQEELLALGIVEMRERYGSHSREIIVPFDPGVEMQGVTFTVPRAGERKKLLDLSVLNVKQYKADRVKQADKLNPEQRSTRLLKEIQDALHLEHLPVRIECFDNSNIQGTDAVAGCVVFIKGNPSKQDYRKYNIKTVEGPDDYASMQEVVRRRYSRAVEEGSPLPDLLITDGGKGQMSSVQEVLDELGLHIPVAGLAKDGKHRTSELLFGSPPVTIGMKQGTPLFNLMTRIQDEVHRYAITFHRDKRSKRQVASELDTIKGIGPKAKEALLRTFKSVKRVREASDEELKAVVGQAKAQLLKKHFLKKE